VGLGWGVAQGGGKNEKTRGAEIRKEVVGNTFLTLAKGSSQGESGTKCQKIFEIRFEIVGEKKKKQVLRSQSHQQKQRCERLD